MTGGGVGNMEIATVKSLAGIISTVKVFLLSTFTRKLQILRKIFNLSVGSVRGAFSSLPVRPSSASSRLTPHLTLFWRSSLSYCQHSRINSQTISSEFCLLLVNSRLIVTERTYIQQCRATCGSTGRLAWQAVDR